MIKEMEERRENLKMEYNGEIINNILPGTQIDSFKSSRAAYNVGHKKRDVVDEVNFYMNKKNKSKLWKNSYCAEIE